MSIYNLYNYFPSKIQKAIDRKWYQWLSKMDREGQITFMNWGYAELDDTEPPIPLYPSDEANQYSIQLYHKILNEYDLKNAIVLEIGCGRGGGCAFIKRYYEAKHVIGVDYNQRAIQFCCRKFHLPGLEFLSGDAESLPFKTERFDFVLCVESSHCFFSVSRFLNEVFRVLKKDGYFLLADFRIADQLPLLEQKLLDARFQILRREQLNDHIVKALELDSARKDGIIDEMIPGLLRNIVREFAGIQGKRNTYGKLKSGEKVYFYYVLKR
jgi:SAM-dependent methyltransferase